jgi:hypothetical protein
MIDMKYTVCVLETIGCGLTLSNEADKEAACIVAIKAIDTVEKIKEILNKRDNAFDGQEFGASYCDLDNIIEEIRDVINSEPGAE